jgi:hypothetical protein
MDTRNFKERFKNSQNFEELVKDVLARSGTTSVAGVFPVYTRKEAEELVLGWSNSLEAVGTVLREKEIFCDKNKY